MLFPLFAPVKVLLSSCYHTRLVWKIKTSQGQMHKWVLAICHILYSECIFPTKKKKKEKHTSAWCNKPLPSKSFRSIVPVKYIEGKMGQKGKNKQIKITPQNFKNNQKSTFRPFILKPSTRSKFKVFICHWISASSLGYLPQKVCCVFCCCFVMLTASNP